MGVEEALASYELKRHGIALQHRYIAQGQKEVAMRMAIIPTQEADVAWAKGCLDSALGKQVDWAALREQVKAARALTEQLLDDARGWKMHESAAVSS